MFKFVLFLILLGVIIFVSIQLAPTESLVLVKAFTDYAIKMAVEIYTWTIKIIGGLNATT
jgi:membrane carboxypeptidase/penicillin-binding protein